MLTFVEGMGFFIVSVGVCRYLDTGKTSYMPFCIPHKNRLQKIAFLKISIFVYIFQTLSIYFCRNFIIVK